MPRSSKDTRWKRAYFMQSLVVTQNVGHVLAARFISCDCQIVNSDTSFERTKGSVVEDIVIKLYEHKATLSSHKRRSHLIQKRHSMHPVHSVKCCEAPKGVCTSSV